MTKFRFITVRKRRDSYGMTLIELLTCVMIIGIATAGSMELAYVNAFWAANGMNKADNLYTARRFLDVLNRDLRNSATVIQSSSSTSSTVILTRSQDLATETVDVNGFPTATEQVIYTISPDPNSTDSATTDFMIQRQASNGMSVTVLTGLVGPLNKTSPTVPGIFQYASLNDSMAGSDGLSFNPGPLTHSVVVNLELKRVSVGAATASMNESTTHSFEAIRSEIFMRNSVFGMGR